jgi:rhodanese-related sulfurtransferase
MKKLLTLLATSALAVSWSCYAGEFPDVSVTEVKALAESKKAVIIDVNGTESYKKGHVPGALDYAAIKDKLAEVLPKDKNATIVAYCGGPKCKAYQAAATAAEKLGYKNVKHMSRASRAGRKPAEMEEQLGHAAIFNPGTLGAFFSQLCLDLPLDCNLSLKEISAGAIKLER